MRVNIETKHGKYLHAKTTRDLLCAEKAQIYNASRARATRVPQQKQCAVSKVLKKGKSIPNERHLKHRGIVQEEYREMIRDL
ncbi:hypothetical protein L208DRAFT_1392217 [Tricholoma matsutake]|nr:hypothetical protein L208DRAFT_1392217 [Tricholoma matsutake 945]